MKTSQNSLIFLKKKITKVLNLRKHNNSSFVFLIPTIVLQFNLLKVTFPFAYGVFNQLKKNKDISAPIINSYKILKNKIDLFTVVIKSKQIFYMLKFKNLYFSSYTFARYNFSQFFLLNNFIVHLRKLYFYFFTYLFFFKKKLVAY